MAQQWVEARKTICIDWNGVLDTYVGWRGGLPYPPRDGAREFLKALNVAGYEVVILSSADPDTIYKWLVEYNMADYVAKITREKVPALVYVDDRAVCFRGDFNWTLAQIIEFKTHWEDKKHHEGGNLGQDR